MLPFVVLGFVWVPFEEQQGVVVRWVGERSRERSPTAPGRSMSRWDPGVPPPLPHQIQPPRIPIHNTRPIHCDHSLLLQAHGYLHTTPLGDVGGGRELHGVDRVWVQWMLAGPGHPGGSPGHPGRSAPCLPATGGCRWTDGTRCPGPGCRCVCGGTGLTDFRRPGLPRYLSRARTPGPGRPRWAIRWSGFRG